MYCADDTAGGSIADIDYLDLMYFTDILISDNAADKLISADSGYSTDCADANVLDDAVYVLTMLTCLYLCYDWCYGK